jgi:phosphomannomutase
MPALFSTYELRPLDIDRDGDEELLAGAGWQLHVIDPDGDRLALVDAEGEPIGEDLTLALAVQRVLSAEPGEPRDAGRRSRRSGPPVVTNLSTSRVVQDAAEGGGASLVRVPVGEIHVAQRMVELGSAIGGEGNGGVIYPAVHLTRDAGSAAALVLSLLAAGPSTLADAVRALPAYTIVKETVEVGTAVPSVDPAPLEAMFPEAARDLQDGIRLAWEAEREWLHVRPSGTEPIVRVIAEARSPDRARELVRVAREALEAPEARPRLAAGPAPA